MKFICAISIVLIVLLVNSSCPAAMVAHWKLDDGSPSTTAADETGVNNGTLSGGPTWITGYIGTGALSFDNINDHVDCGNNASVNINSTTITISAWIYPANYSSGSWILGKMGNSSGSYGLFLNTTGNVVLGMDTGSGWSDSGPSSTTISVNQWSHVAATYNGSIVQYYVNGQPAGTAGRSGSIVPKNHNLMIGWESGWNSQRWNGYLDDIRLWNETLDSTEILNLYNNSQLTISSDPSIVNTIFPYANDAQGQLSGVPISIQAYPTIDCPNSITYIFDHWQVNSNAVIADTDNPVTTVTINQGAINAQITAHYTSTPSSSTDCMDRHLWFDGDDDYVDITGYSGITGGNSRTVAAWVRTDKPGTIVSWGDTAVGQRWLFHINNGVATIHLGSGNAIGSTYILDDRCHHIAAVLEDDGSPTASEIKLYVDGKPETMTYSEFAVNTGSNADVRIGSAKHFLSGSVDFDGFISDVRIYNRALSPTEVGLLADGTEVSTGLSAHWPLDEFNYNMAYDAVGSNDGTINGQFIRALGMLCAHIPPTPLTGDINRDKIVDLVDLSRLAEDWLIMDCEKPYYCMGADIDEDQSVNLKDYASFSGNWLAEIQSLHNMGFVVITHNGPDDGGDFGGATPGTATQGIQEAIDYGVANEKDVYILGTEIYFASDPIYFPPAKNWRFVGPGYGINFDYATGDYVVFDSLINCDIELGLLIGQVPGIENGNSLAMVRPQNPIDGEIAVRNSKILINAPVGGGNVWGGGYDGKGTGLTLDPLYGPIEHNTFVMLEINACNTGLELLSGNYPIRNNSFACPFNHITNNPMAIYSGVKNKFDFLIDVGGTVTPGIGCNIYAAEHNVFRLFPPSGGALGSNTIVFGADSKDNIVFAENVEIDSATNNSNYDTNKLIVKSTPGFSVSTPLIPGTGTYQKNETLCTVAVIITNEGTLSSWQIKDSLGNSRLINSGLYQGQQIYLEPGDEILFNYISPPQWRWRALER